MTRNTDDSTPDALPETCFHCGQRIPQGLSLSVQVEGVPRRLCCLGCQAVCESIISNGLSEYYRHRIALPEGPAAPIPAGLAELGLFDHPEFQKTFVRPLGEGEQEADLILEGITCSACVWLNEQHLAKLPGIVGVQVNYATRRARVRWHPGEILLSQILAAVQSIGYRAHPYDADKSEEVARQERRTALWRLFVAGLGMMQVMMYAYPAYVASEGEMTSTMVAIMRWASMALTAPVVFFSAAPFFQRAWRDLTLRRIGMDVPVALGVGSAFLASVWGTVTGSGEVYFDSVTMFVFFLLGGRYLEMLARQRASRGGDLLGRLVPTFARRISADGLVEERVPASMVQAGDLLLVRPGEVVVADGAVLSGQPELDESWLTGESRPQSKREGSPVLTGSINGGQAFTYRVEKVGEATRLATIRRLMERAASERPRLAQMADRVATRFTVVILLLATLTALFWWHTDPARAFQVFISVLVVSCPCALSLATPAALTVATDAFGRAGLLVTRGHAIETLAKATRFAFDKTGTLTRGALQVENVILTGVATRSEVLEVAAALEQHSEHSIARALSVMARPSVAAVNVSVAVGQGIAGTVGDETYALGNGAYVAEFVSTPMPEVLRTSDETSRTAVFLANRHAWLAAIQLTDTLRDEATPLIEGLRKLGVKLTILSGDTQGPVRTVGKVLGIDDARFSLSPEGKHAALQALQRNDVVVMVGDGVNDAPVLAGAHLSVAMSGGSELARNCADVVLLGNELDRLLVARALARKTLAVVRQNLWWAFAYNVLSIPAAMAGWVTPWLAGIGMGGSSVFVILNALRIARPLRED